MPDRVRDGLLRLRLVGGLDDRNVRQRADARDVLEPHLAVAVLADRDARVRADELHVGVGVGNGHADRFEAAHDEARERADERHLAGQREPRADPDHVRFGDADVEGPIGVRLGEADRHRGLREVGVDRDDAVVGRRQLKKGLAKRGATGLWRHYVFSRGSSSATLAAVSRYVFTYETYPAILKLS